jgi:uncharacterized protein YqjF (DUF2071 family)
MTETSTGIDRIAPMRRPEGRPAGYQNWSNLLFVHWRVLVSELRPLIPQRLTIDTYEGHAWVGLVLFHMSGVRPRWFPAIPGLSAFHETNVRTYVHLDGKDPGVWFFSLDASCSLAVRVARRRWHLPYFRSAMQLHRSGDRVQYRSERLWPGEVGPGVSIETEIGEPLAALNRDFQAGQAVPGTFEHFLAERYLLYAQRNNGDLYAGRVHHVPYPLREARMLSLQESLLNAARISPRNEQQHVMFSEGVNVEIFPLRQLPP